VNPLQDRGFTHLGRRNFGLILLGAQTGLRVSEIIGLNRGDLCLGVGAHVRCEGKGRKQRAVPLTGPPRRCSANGHANAADEPRTRCSQPAQAGG